MSLMNKNWPGLIEEFSLMLADNLDDYPNHDVTGWMAEGSRMAPVPAVDGMAWSQAGRTSRVRSGGPDGKFDPFRPCAADPLNPAGRKRKMFVHCSK